MRQQIHSLRCKQDLQPRSFRTLFSATFLALLGALILTLGTLPAFGQSSDLVISGVIDGPLSGGVPKAIELYVVNDITDLSVYGVGSANNGGGSDGEEFTFPAVAATAGDFIYIASSGTTGLDGFTNFFGFAPDYQSDAASINGDDAIELFKGGAVVDVFGDINTDGTGQPWEHLDGWAYRNSGTGPDGSTFVLGSWFFSGPNALDGETSNATAAVPFPIGTYAAGGGAPTPTPTPTDPPVAAGLVINEIDYDQVGSDAAEYVELYNASAGAINLSGYVLQFVNGSNGSTYDTISLPAATLPAGDYFVICANMATTPNCDLDDGPDTNFIQNGSPDAVALLLAGNIVDTVSYEGSVAGFTEGTGTAAADSNSVANIGLSRLPDGADTNNNNADFSIRCVTPGAANTSDATSCPPPGGFQIGQCFDDNATLISAVQGDGATTPLNGQTVIIEGVVTGDFQDTVGTNGDLNGFYVQEEESQDDGNPLTSEGIFVFQGSNPAIDVSISDVVRVLGTATEFTTSGGASSLTQINNVSDMIVCGTVPALAPADVTLPVAAVSDLERYEGMFVRLPQQLVIAEYFNFDRFNEIVLALPLPGEDRPHQPTAIHEPGSPEAAARADLNARSRITLDDGRTSQNTVPAIHPNGGVFTFTNTFRGGDLVTNAVGVIDDTFGVYRIQPTAGADYTSVNPRPATPDDVGGRIKVASFNVLNYFTTIDPDPTDSSSNDNPADNICGGLQNLECRGADDANELARQQTKIVDALALLDADVVGLIEIENTADVNAVQTLVDALNAQVGAGTYAAVDTGAIGTDAIKVAFIYQPASVTPAGSPAVLDDPSFVNPFGASIDRNRPAVAQTFDENATGERFTAVVNHLKSKGSGCGAGDDDPEQGNCNGTRTAAADVLVDWLATDPTTSYDPDYMIIGDLNAYDKEDPIDAVVEGADDTAGTNDDYTDLTALYGGEFAYSFVFSGQFGYLDYALANQPLTGQTTGATEWHINADEPDIWDYDTAFNDPGFFEANQYRASDHDPVIVGLDLMAPVSNLNAALGLASTSTSFSGEAQPDAPAGVFTISATFVNNTDDALRQIYFEVVTLTNNNLLLNADGGPAGVGARLSVPGNALGPDATLTPGESFTVEFQIGLAVRAPFDFFVDAFGTGLTETVNGAARTPGSSIQFSMNPDSAEINFTDFLYLPAVGK